MSCSGWKSWRYVPVRTSSITVGSRSRKTQRGTCLPAPVSEKKVLNASSPPPMVLSEGIWPLRWGKAGEGRGNHRSATRSRSDGQTGNPGLARTVARTARRAVDVARRSCARNRRGECSRDCSATLGPSRASRVARFASVRPRRSRQFREPERAILNDPGKEVAPAVDVLRLDTVLEAVQLPARVTGLDTGLADVDGDDFTHGCWWRVGERRRC